MQAGAVPGSRYKRYQEERCVKVSYEGSGMLRRERG